MEAYRKLRGSRIAEKHLPFVCGDPVRQDLGEVQNLPSKGLQCFPEGMPQAAVWVLQAVQEHHGMGSERQSLQCRQGTTVPHSSFLPFRYHKAPGTEDRSPGFGGTQGSSIPAQVNSEAALTARWCWGFGFLRRRRELRASPAGLLDPSKRRQSVRWRQPEQPCPSALLPELSCQSTWARGVEWGRSEPGSALGLGAEGRAVARAACSGELPEVL